MIEIKPMGESAAMAIEVIFFLAITAGVIVYVVPGLIPAYNNGNGIPTGNADLTFINTMTMGNLQAGLGGISNNPSAIDYARLVLDLMIAVLIGIAIILLTVIVAVPALVIIFGIPLKLALMMQIPIYLTYLIFYLQVKNKGVSWDQYR